MLNGKAREAVCKFVELLRDCEVEADSITFCAFLNACADGKFFIEGKQLHGNLVKGGHEGDVPFSNGLVDFYGKCREVGFAERVFGDMRKRNCVSWCSMLVVFEQNDMGEKACGVFLKARRAGFEHTGFMISSVLSACAGLAALEAGRAVHGLARCVLRMIYLLAVHLLTCMANAEVLLTAQ